MVHYFLGCSCKFDDFLCKIPDGNFIWVPNVDRQCIIAVQQSENSFYLVVNKAKRTGLASVAKNCQVFASQCLSDESRNNTTVIESHSRPISVENPYNSGFYAVKSMVGHCDGFLKTLGFIINAARANGVDISIIFLGLRVD